MDFSQAVTAGPTQTMVRDLGPLMWRRFMEVASSDELKIPVFGYLTKMRQLLEQDPQNNDPETLWRALDMKVGEPTVPGDNTARQSPSINDIYCLIFVVEQMPFAISALCGISDHPVRVAIHHALRWGYYAEKDRSGESVVREIALAELHHIYFWLFGSQIPVPRQTTASA